MTKSSDLTLTGAIGVADKIAADLRARSSSCIERNQLHEALRLSEEALAVDLLVAVARLVIKGKTCPGCGWSTDAVCKTVNCRLGSDCMCGSER